MSKTQEFKAYGSIRKMKVGGACGVILALAMLGMVFSSTASADEVSVNTSENKTILEVPIVHEKLDKAIAEAKEAGVKVDVGVTQDKGVATTDTVADKQKEIEADYVNQEKNVKTVTDDYSSKVDKTTKEREVIEKENKDKQDKFEKDVKDHEAEVKRIEAENKAILADNDKKQKEIEAENAQIKRDNAQKETDYETALANQKSFNENVDKENTAAKSTYETKLEEYRKKLAVYEKQQAELNNKDLKIEKPHIKVYGDYDESQRGSLDYYKKLTVSFEGVEDLIDVKDYIGLHSDSSITASREGLLSKSNEFFGEIVDPKAGDSFTIHNVAERKDGNKISARFTFNKVEAEWVENGKSLSPTKIYVHKDDSGSGSINFLFANLVEFNTKIDFFYEKDKKEVVLAVASAFNDIDYGQELNLTYQDGSEGIVLNPNGSDVKKVVRDGKNYYKGEYKTPWTYDVPELGVNAGDLGYANVRDEKDIPRGSIVSIGYGSTLNLGYHNGVGQRAPHEIFQERVNAIRDALYEGKKTPPDSEIFSSKKVGWAVGLFGKASATVPINIHVNPPLKPELKLKDTKEIPKPKLEKPKEFVPRTTLPVPPAPTPPEKKKIPEMPLVPTVKVNYSRLRVKPSTPKPVKAITDNYGHNIDGATTFDKNVKFSLTTDYKPYSTFTADSKNVAKTWALADDVQDGAYMVDDSKITMKDSIGKDVKALFNMYHVLSEKERTQEIQNILKEAGLNPKGEFYLWVAKDSTSFYQNYVKQAKNITIDLPARLLVKAGEVVGNEFVQVDYGNGYKSNLVTVKVPDVKSEKHALDKTGQKVLDGKEVQMGELIQYLLDGSMIPERHDTLYQYDGLDKLDTKHDRYTGNWKGIIKGTEYTAEKELTLPYDVILKDGKVVKAGDKIAKGSSYAFTFEFNQGTNSEFIKKLVTVKWDDKGGQWSYVINQDFLNSLGIKGTFDADFYIEVERIETGDKIENTFVNIVNKQEMTAKVITRTPEPPKPKHPEKHALDKTGQKVLDGKEVQMGELIQYLLDGSMIPERHDTLYQYDGLDKLDTKHDRYTGNWKGIIKGTEYTAEKELTLPYDVILKDGKVVKAGDKIAKGSSYAFTFEFNQGTNSEFIKKLVTVKWDDKGGQWSYVINQDFLNSLGIKGTFDADFYIEVERIETGDKIENTFVNIVNKQEMTAKVITRTPEPPKPKHPEKHALDKTGQKVLDGKEVQMGELIQYLLDGSMIPERHDTLYQYDGLDKLDTKHDRYTGNWKGIIKGTEYTAEKELTLPYDVILKDGKVVKAGDKIAKGSSYAFTFEFNQGTNSEFIKKLVTVKWDDKGGQWSYVINQDFLNSLGIKGTFDADFYIEVERIETGDKIENTFVNIVNKQEMTAKVITRTPEPPKPKHPEKHALDKTGQKVLDGKEVQMGELIQYLLDGSMIPERHDTLYQYDGLDKLDTKHDRYTGNWKGIIKGTEYTAEKELTLPYDVILKDGKVVKAGDKIAKGSSYAFTFEFNQGTNSEFIKKLVTVKWDAKGGQWSYVINQDFLNSLGIKGTFDADFYIEVERIAAGEVENTFVNIVNGQEMIAKVTTHTPEPPKPEESGKPKQSLPNTGTASSMLPVVGMILGLLSLAGLRKSKEN